MTESVFEQPTPENLNAFVAGDPIAIDHIVRLLLPQIYRWAIKQYSSVPPEEVQSVVNQVFAETCIHHARYDPSQSRLTTYIISLLKLRMIDVLESETSVLTDEDLSEKIDLQPYNQVEQIDAATRITRDVFFSMASKSLSGLEQDFLQLMLQGEKHSRAYDAIIKRHGLPPDTSEIKNTKERIVRKLRNLADECGYKFEDLMVV